MKFSIVLPLLSIASSALAVTVTTTEIDYVKGVVEFIVQEIVEIRYDTTVTYEETSTHTRFYTDAKFTQPSTTNTNVDAPTTTALADTTIVIEDVTPVADTTTLAGTTTIVDDATAAAPVAAVATPVADTTTLAPVNTDKQTPTTLVSVMVKPATTSNAAAPAATTTAAADTLSSFAKEILDATNAKRALAHVNPLTWSTELANYAQNRADNYDCSGVLTHSEGKYGENLAAGYSTSEAVDAWFNEYTSYSSANPVASHFTQLAWKSTTQLGCASKYCGSYWGQYIICSYNPAGNIAGQYADNVSLP